MPMLDQSPLRVNVGPRSADSFGPQFLYGQQGPTACKTEGSVTSSFLLHPLLVAGVMAADPVEGVLCLILPLSNNCFGGIGFLRMSNAGLVRFSNNLSTLELPGRISNGDSGKGCWDMCKLFEELLICCGDAYHPAFLLAMILFGGHQCATTELQKGEYSTKLLCLSISAASSAFLVDSLVISVNPASPML